MFEIGNSLREARVRQGLDLTRVEADTKIRAKYLQALEEENFDLLPGETYVKGFLRTYANYLRLDGQLYVDEFNSRFATYDEPIASQPRSRPRSRPTESNFVVVGLAGIIAVTVLVVVAWQFGTGGKASDDEVVDLLGGQTTVAIGSAPAPQPEPPPVTTTEAPLVPAPVSKPKSAKLILTAVYGPCWISVRTNSADGELLYEGTLEKGQTQQFTKKRLWIELGAGENLVVAVNGSPTEFPDGASVVVVSAKGVEVVST